MKIKLVWESQSIGYFSIFKLIDWITESLIFNLDDSVEAEVMRYRVCLLAEGLKSGRVRNIRIESAA